MLKQYWTVKCFIPFIAFLIVALMPATFDWATFMSEENLLAAPDELFPAKVGRLMVSQSSNRKRNISNEPFTDYSHILAEKM